MIFGKLFGSKENKLSAEELEEAWTQLASDKVLERARAILILSAAHAQAAAWTVREELRLGNGAFIDDLPAISRLVTGPDGRVYALSWAADAPAGL